MTTGIGGPRPLTRLPQTRDAAVDASTLAPWIEKYAQQYGANPQLIAAVVAQESSFVNYGVHHDGTGHGLIGLDDNGLLPDFERWSGRHVGRGRHANTIPPEQQIEFLARTLGELTAKFGGDEWEAVRAWHAGIGGRDRPNGREYETLIRGRISEIADAVPRVMAGAAPPDERLASAFERPAGKPLSLQPVDGTPVRGPGIDYEKA